MLNIFTIFSLYFAVMTPNSTPNKGTLELVVQNIKSEGGMVWVGVYGSKEDFMIKEKATLVGVRVEARASLTIEIPDLTYGEYALAVFHDENNNGEMDRNLVGIPSEPFAFSKPPVSKLRIPKFEEVKFQFTPEKAKLTARLKKWWQS